MLNTCLMIWTVLSIIGVSTITRSPSPSKQDDELQKVEDFEERTAEVASEIDGNIKSLAGVSLESGLKSLRYWHMALMLFFGDFLGMYIAQVYKVIALDTLSDK